METTEGSVEVIEETKGDLLILKIKGRLDAISTPSAERGIFAQINQGNHRLLLDFTALNYLSSAGMRMLLSITKKLKALSGKLVLCCVSSQVMDVLKMSGFDHVLEIYSTQEEAIRKF